MIGRQRRTGDGVRGFVLASAILAAGTVPQTALAGVATFTWDPAGAIPALSGGGSAFTADAIQGGHYLHSVQPVTTAPMPQPTYLVDFIEQINSFTLHGAPVATPGLNAKPGGAGSYGLYLAMQAVTQYVGPPSIYDYHSMSVRLMADPGNENGAVMSTMAGLGFANTGPTGAEDDITLATGSLVSGHFTLNPTPDIRSIGVFEQTLQAAPGEAGFFVTPLSPFGVIEEVLTTLPANIMVVPDPGEPGYTITTLNGGTAAIGLRVPEPASLTVLCGGLVALSLLRRRPAPRP